MKKPTAAKSSWWLDISEVLGICNPEHGPDSCQGQKEQMLIRAIMVKKTVYKKLYGAQLGPQAGPKPKNIGENSF